MRPFRSLSSGTIGVFAASSPFPRERYLAGRAVLERAGFMVREAKGLFDEAGYLAGADADRAKGLLELLEDDSVGALWAVRGGYGLGRILPLIEDALWVEKQKPVLGFSDVTALHGLLAQRGLESLHAPVLTQLGELDADTARSTFELMAGKRAFEYPSNGPRICGGRARGPLLGGNLSVLSSLLGTPYFPSLDGCILMLEDVGEATYRIDRLLTQLLLSGALAGVRGIALGEFTGCRPRNDREPVIEKVLEERLARLQVPVLAGLPFGHGHRNLPFIHGRTHELDADLGLMSMTTGSDAAELG